MPYCLSNTNGFYHLGKLLDLERFKDFLNVNPSTINGIVLGIGMPDGRMPPYRKELKKLDSDYQTVYGDFNERFGEGSGLDSYFSRLFVLNELLNGEAPLSNEARSALVKEFTGVVIPFPKVHPVPKPPHQLYRGYYDFFFQKDGRGIFEPPKTEIHTQFITLYQGEEERNKIRIKVKQTQPVEGGRGIVIQTFDEGSLSNDDVRKRKTPLFDDEGKKEIKERLSGKEFDLCIVRFGPDGYDRNKQTLGENQKRDIATVLNAYVRKVKKDGICIAIPYRPEPNISIEIECKDFWQSLLGGNGGMPFERERAVREYLIGLNPGEEVLRNTMTTFVEMGEDGKFIDPKKSMGYLPPQFVPHGHFYSYLGEELKEAKKRKRTR